MPYVLVAVAVMIFVIGLRKVQRADGGTHRTPWTALAVWAALFGLGVFAWLHAMPIR